MCSVCANEANNTISAVKQTQSQDVLIACMESELPGAVKNQNTNRDRNNWAPNGMQFGTCASFFRRALQKFSFGETVLHSTDQSVMKNDFSATRFNADAVIELRHIDDTCSSRAHRANGQIRTSASGDKQNKTEQSPSLISTLREKLSLVSEKEEIDQAATTGHRFSLTRMPSFKRINVTETLRKSLNSLNLLDTNSESNTSLCTESDRKRSVVQRETVHKQEESSNRSQTSDSLSSDEVILFEKPPRAHEELPSKCVEETRVRPNRPTNLEGLRTKSELLSRSTSVECHSKSAPLQPLESRRMSASPRLDSSSNEVHVTTPLQMQNSSSSVSATSLSPVTVIANCVETGYTSEESFQEDNAIIVSNSNSSLASSDIFDENLSGVESGNDHRSNEESPDSDKTDTLSVDSQPLELHCYFHLFRRGELEQLVKSVGSLRVTESYFSERDCSWCVISEKIAC